MAANKGLGKGLGALLGESAMQPSTQQSPLLLPLQKIEPNRLQPRKSFNEEELAALADSIRQHGVIQPLTVRLLDTGYYQIIAGERRWRAARMAGLREVPVVIIEADDKKAMELALIENLQRADLTPIEEARGYQQLIGEYGLTQEQVADRVSKSRPAVANAMRLLSLPDELLSMVESGKLTTGHARALLSIKDERQQLAVAPEPKPVEVDYLAECEKTLTRCLGRGVKIVAGKRKGKIELEYYGQEDLQRLYEALSGSLGKEQP